MQEQTLNFTAQAQAQVTLAERARELGRVANAWLDTKSDFYSRIADFTVTRRTAIRVNMVTLMMVVAAIAVETNITTALMAALATAWLLYRFNVGKKGGKR